MVESDAVEELEEKLPEVAVVELATFDDGESVPDPDLDVSADAKDVEVAGCEEVVEREVEVVKSDNAVWPAENSLDLVNPEDEDEEFKE
jgi:hypothetical protein